MTEMHRADHEYVIRLLLFAVGLGVTELIAAGPCIDNGSRIRQVATLAAHDQHAVASVRMNGAERQHEFDMGFPRIVRWRRADGSHRRGHQACSPSGTRSSTVLSS